MFLISSFTIHTFANFSSSIFKKIASDTQFSHEFLDFSETTASLSSLVTRGMLHGLLYLSTVFIRSLVPGVFISGTLEILN